MTGGHGVGGREGREGGRVVGVQGEVMLLLLLLLL